MIFLLVILTAVTGDPNQQLTGGGWREWTSLRFEMTLGNLGGCKTGELYRFAVDHTVEIQQCLDGIVTDRVEKWSIDRSDRPGTYITIGDKNYLLVFPEVNGSHDMRLEYRPYIIGDAVVKVFWLSGSSDSP
jgi:hypothetical protein